MAKSLTAIFSKDKSNSNAMRNRIVAVASALVVATVGYVLVASHAASFFASVSPADATLSANAKVITDADGTKSVQFTAPASTGGGSGTGTGGSTPPPRTGSPPCPLPAYPSPSCSGRPSSLTSFANTVNGDYSADTPGQVIDNWHIVGHILIRAANITIKNSLIEGSITNEVDGGFKGNFAVADTTIVNGPGSIYTGPSTAELQANSALKGAGEYCDSEPAIGQINYTATRVFIDHHVTGIQTSHTGNVNVSDSFVKVCGLSPEYTTSASVIHSPDGSHSDPFQAYCPEAPGITCDNVTFNHNTLDDLVRPIVSHKNGQAYVDTVQYVTAPYFANEGPSNGYGQNYVVTNNLMMGGAYSMYTGWRAGPAMVITGNRIVDHSWAYAYGDQNGSCSNIKWSDNTSVTVDSGYKILSTVQAYPCQN